MSKEQSFDEQFPSLKSEVHEEETEDGFFEVISREDVEEHCLDKAKVMEFFQWLFFGWKDECPYSKEQVLEKMKELGLDV